jgi:hypothetical protein
MALTRAQLLSGNQGQGDVLLGQVQAVKKGAGIAIATDGTISVDSTTVTGLMKLNSLTAYNAYVWPNAGGVSGSTTFLSSDGSGNLDWKTTQGFPVVTVGPLTPAPPEVGELWFDTGSSTLKVYQTTTAPTGWTTTSQAPGLGLAISGSFVKVSIPIQFGPPATGVIAAGAIDGSMYWDNNLGEMFIRYNDGSSTQWVQITPSGGGGGGTGTVTSVGITGSGGITSLGGPITSSGVITVGFSLPSLPVLP